MKVEHISLEPFEPLFIDIYNLTFGNSFQGLIKSGIKFEDVWHTEANKIFKAACIQDINEAQIKIGKHVIELEIKIKGIKKSEIEYRRKKDFQKLHELKTLIDILRDRQLILRRLIDSMIWLLYWPEKWILRRLRNEGGIRAVDVESINSLLDYFEKEKSDDENSISIICDLSTISQLGDIIIYRWDPNKNSEKIVIGELKVGKTNVSIYNKLHDPKYSNHADAILNISKEMGEHAKKQAERILKQEQKLENFNSVVSLGVGVEPISGQPYRMSEHPIYIKDFRDVVFNLLTQAKLNPTKVVGKTLDTCLYLLAFVVSNNKDDYEQLRIAHLFYQHKNNISGDKCELTSVEIEASELRKAPKAVDLLNFGLRNSIGLPPLLWYSPQIMFDALFERVRIFAQFDYEKFFELAHEYGLKLSFFSGKQATKIKHKKISGTLFEYNDDRYISAENSSGKKMMYGSRFTSRIYLELIRPIDIIRMIIEGFNNAN